MATLTGGEIEVSTESRCEHKWEGEIEVSTESRCGHKREGEIEVSTESRCGHKRILLEPSDPNHKN